MFQPFQKKTLRSLDASTGASEALSRMHQHFQHVAALYAWQMKAPGIELAHVEAAKIVVETSLAFVQELLAERDKTVVQTFTQAGMSAREKRILEYVETHANSTRREVALALARGDGVGEVSKAIDGLCKAQVLATRPQESNKPGPKRMVVFVVEEG